MADILVLHGPNLNLLGQREPGIYGHTQLAEINQQLEQTATQAGFTLASLQSNAEHNLVEAIQTAPANNTRFLIINPAAFTHTSIALRDAISAVDLPFIEVHLSNVASRETFRHHSYFSDIATGTITGLGPQVYDLALQAVIQRLQSAN